MAFTGHAPAFEDGCKRGWTDGKSLGEGYTLGEECVIAEETADELELAPGSGREAWERGYCQGYRRAVEAAGHAVLEDE